MVPVDAKVDFVCSSDSEPEFIVTTQSEDKLQTVTTLIADLPDEKLGDLYALKKHYGDDEENDEDVHGDVEAAESAAESRAKSQLSSLRVAFHTYKTCVALRGTDGTQLDAELRQSLRERVGAELRRQQEEETAPGPGLPTLTAGLTRLAAELLKEESVPDLTAEKEVLLPAKTPEVAPGESVPGLTAEKEVLSPAKAPEESAPGLTGEKEVLLPAKAKYPPAEAQSAPGLTAEKEVFLPAKTREVAPGESVPGLTAEKEVLSPAKAPEESAPGLTAEKEVLLPAKAKYPPAEAQSATGLTADKEVLLPAKAKYPPAEAKHPPAKAEHALMMFGIPKGGWIQPKALPKVMPKAI